MVSKRAGQTRCDRWADRCKCLVKCNVNGWSVPMQSGGQVECDFAPSAGLATDFVVRGISGAVEGIVAVSSVPHSAYTPPHTSLSDT
jgi:hypothetical protein